MKIIRLIYNEIIETSPRQVFVWQDKIELKTESVKFKPMRVQQTSGVEIEFLNLLCFDGSKIKPLCYIYCLFHKIKAHVAKRHWSFVIDSTHFS